MKPSMLFLNSYQNSNTFPCIFHKRMCRKLVLKILILILPLHLLCNFSSSLSSLYMLRDCVSLHLHVPDMGTTTFRTLEITVLSCEDLRIDRKWVKKNTYVMVRTDHINCSTSKIDKEGGAYPFWNQKLTIDMALLERFITLEVHCKTPSGDRTIGTARMPSTDFMGGYLPYNYLNFLSYRLRDAKGERNGIINVSVKVKRPEYDDNALKPKTVPAGIPIDSGENIGFVTGVPVWGGNHTCNSIF